MMQLNFHNTIRPHESCVWKQTNQTYAHLRMRTCQSGLLYTYKVVVDILFCFRYKW